jgi:N-methylhydantoinase A
VTVGVGFDVGGSFTDCALLDGLGRWEFTKVRTTPDDRARACIDGIGLVLAQAGVAGVDVGHLTHGSTVVTNTIIERTGARTALVTTSGFADVLEIRRQVAPVRYDVNVPKPEPLVRRPLRLEVSERTLADGTIERELDERATGELAARLSRDGVESVAISFLHSYANPRNKRRAEDVLRAGFGGFVTASHRVINEMREYERTSTVVANAYVAPPVARYLERLQLGLRDENGIAAPLLVFQSNGGLAPAEQVRDVPIRSLLSGPAAGVVAACAVARQAGVRDFVSLDMGGTSCDAALVEDLTPRMALDQDTAGWAIRVPRLAIHTVGAGGGSIARLDSGGLLTVGPESAGADPGPACYGGGGTDATVTDAHVALGRIGPGARLGGRLGLEPDGARSAVRALATTVELDEETAAAAILDVVNATMVRAIRVISVEQGRDPRELSMVAFGGAGPLHACDLARELRLRSVIVPPAPGLLCAIGLLVADLRLDGSMTRRLGLDTLEPAAVRAAFSELEGGLRASAAVVARRDVPWRAVYSLDMRYVGQSFELPVPLTREELGAPLAWLADRFDRVHEQHCGHATPKASREIVAFRVSLCAPAGIAPTELPRVAGGRRRPRSRRVFFRGTGWVDRCPVHPRHGLQPGAILEGPAIVEQMDTTIVVAPDFRALVDEHSNLLLTPG